MDVREKIKNWRIGRDLTQTQAEQITGIPASLISMLEKGTREFTRDTIQKYLNADPSFFSAEDFFNKSAPPPENQAGAQ